MAKSLLDRLHKELGDVDFRRLMEATGGGRHLPFGPGAREAEASVLMDADEDLLDILARCEDILDSADDAVDARAPAVLSESLCFSFEEAGPELEHFLGSLQKNGFPATTVTEGEVHVFVRLEGVSDLEFFRLRETLHSLHEIASVARGKLPKGRRLY